MEQSRLNSSEPILYRSKYQDSVPAEKYGGLVTNLHWEKLDQNAEKYIFIDYPSKRMWKAKQVKSMSSQIARYCIDKLKLPPEFRSVLIYENDDYSQITALGINFAGGSICVSGPSASTDEISYQIQIVKPNLVGVPKDKIQLVLRVKEQLKLDYKILLLDDIEPPNLNIEIVCLHKDMLTYQEDSTVLPVQVNPNASISVLLTSGSTGRPKPVIKSQISNLYNCYSINDETRELWDLDENTVLAGNLALDHTSGNFLIAATLAIGSTIVFMPGFDEETLMKATDEFKITDCFLGSALAHNFIKYCETVETESYKPIASLRNLIPIGSPVPCHETVYKFMKTHPNLSIRPSYGNTECSFVSVSRRNETYLDTVGYLLPNLTVRIVDLQTLEDIKNEDEEGELLVKGPTVFSSYLGPGYEAQLKSAFADSGFYRTNDLVKLLPDGRLKVSGRISEVLCLYDGWKVLPSEIEGILLQHPKILEVAVIGVPHPIYKSCHAPRAYVVAKPGQILDREDVMNFVAQRTSEPKHLKVGGLVIMTEPLPRISLGKVNKKALREITD